MARHGREGNRENSQADERSLYEEPGMVRGRVIARCLSMAMATSMSKLTHRQEAVSAPSNSSRSTLKIVQMLDIGK